MNDELKNLRQEVVKAVAWIDRSIAQHWATWGIIRAELLRLACENAQLRDVLADRDMDREMAAHANKELAALKARIAEAKLIEPGAQFQVPGYVGKRVRLVVENDNG